MTSFRKMSAKPQFKPLITASTTGTVSANNNWDKFIYFEINKCWNENYIQYVWNISEQVRKRVTIDGVEPLQMVLLIGTFQIVATQSKRIGSCTKLWNILAKLCNENAINLKIDQTEQFLVKGETKIFKGLELYQTVCEYQVMNFDRKLGFYSRYITSVFRFLFGKNSQMDTMKLRIPTLKTVKRTFWTFNSPPARVS